MNPANEYVVLVDANDQAIGLAEKLEAHRKGLLHRAFSVFLFRKKEGKIELLLQRRALEKYHAGGLWSNTCCSHPRENEPIIAAAERRIKEEIGITSILEPVGRFQYRAEFSNGLIEHELDYLLVGWDQSSVLIKPNPAEVMQVQWLSLEQVREEYFGHPEQFTPWFKQAFELVIKALNFKFDLDSY